LIVMSTHGRGGLTRLWLGSVADALIRLTAAPVLLFRPRAVQPNFGPAFNVQRILIPIDGSEQSARMIEYAVELGHLATAEYCLLQVVTPPVQVAGITLPSETSVQQLREDALLRMSEIADRMRGRGHQVETAVLFDTDVVHGILDHARAWKPDLIAMTTNARAGWSRVMAGSVADKVLRLSQLPVLLLPPNRAAAEAAPAVRTGVWK
jgi:nucleotide-binding universal stress UspA family protein